ncbi:hypothetical protein GCM10009578_073560 [Streptomyces rhizosphaericus]
MLRTSDDAEEDDMTLGEPRPADAAEARRRARFGTLPERVRAEDMVEERPATAPDSARDAYDSDEWLVRTCL